MDDLRRYFTRVVAVHSDKGGVFKTSLVANLGYYYAATLGLRVLVVDFDPQGNISTDLGITKFSDGGAALYRAMIDGQPYPKNRIVSARPGMTLDVITGGHELRNLERHLIEWDDRYDLLVAPLAPLVGEYDIVLLDTSPKGSYYINPALGVAHHVIIPASTDHTSIDQVADVANTVAEAQNRNPYLDLLGVVIVGTLRVATAQRTSARERLTAMGLSDSIFDGFVAHADATGKAARNEGLTASEFAALQPQRKKDTIDALGTSNAKPTYREAAAGIAQDYVGIGDELIARINAREAEEDQ